MKTNVEQLNPTRSKLTITVTPEEFKPNIDKAYETLAKQVQIPGFRKGKVPPAIIDSRIGAGAVIEQAVNDSLDSYYQQALVAEKVRPFGQPSADVQEVPDPKTKQGDLKFVIEVDVRPEIKLPELDKLTAVVDPIDVTDEDLEESLDKLRERFGTLKTVDRPAKDGDFTSVDLKATIDGEVIDSSTNTSYQIGSGQLLEGIDEALDTLTAGESTTFTSVLVGGDHEGQEATVEVTLNAVKERELPEADDDFAQLASEFDTLDELKDDLRKEVAKSKRIEQSIQARDKVLDKLIDDLDIPLPEAAVEGELDQHLANESKPADDPHRDEVRDDTERNMRAQLVLDAIAEESDIELKDADLSQYAVQQAYRYGMEPAQFIQILQQQGQLPMLMGELMRTKALQKLLAGVKVTDTTGAEVDLSEFFEDSSDEDAEEAAGVAAAEEAAKVAAELDNEAEADEDKSAK